MTEDPADELSRRVGGPKLIGKLYADGDTLYVENDQFPGSLTRVVLASRDPSPSLPAEPSDEALNAAHVAYMELGEDNFDAVESALRAAYRNRTGSEVLMADSPDRVEGRPMTVREAARALGVHENTIRNWQKKGLIGAIFLPGSGYRRFPREEVERMRREMFGGYAPGTVLPDWGRTDVKGGPIRG